jgi:anti-sigma factor RsiW
MKHSNERDLSALIDNELPEQAAAGCREHLAACPLCRARLEDLAHIATLMQRLPRVRIDIDQAWTALSGRLAEPGNVVRFPNAGRHRHLLRPLLAAAAMLGLLVGALLFTALEKSGAPELLKEDCLVEQETDEVIQGYREIARLYKLHR